VAELEAEGVEHESRHWRARRTAPAVTVVSENRKAALRQLHANLVLAPRARTGFDEEPTRQRLDEAEVGLGLLDDTGLW
jgi:phage terminase small subunit